MLKIRRSRDRLIFNMDIPIPGKDGFYIEMGPRRRSSYHNEDINRLAIDYVWYVLIFRRKGFN